jgi:hypothetical protein
MSYDRNPRRPALLRTVLGIFIIGAAAACSSAQPSAPAAATAAATRPAAAAPSCKQQYSAWKYGPARTPGKKLVNALNAVQSASTSEDVPVLLASLKTAGAAAVAAARYPMPACADPHGYWGAMLARIRAAGDNAGSASGLGGLILAEAPLKDVPGIEAKLTAELKKTAQLSPST